MSDQMDDWGDSLDDADGEFWASYFGGPDDSEIENMQEQCAIVDHTEYDDSFKNGSPAAPQFYNVPFDNEIICLGTVLSMDRKQAIIEWIIGSSLAKEMVNRQGYVVSAETFIELESGAVCSLLDWLRGEGFEAENKIWDYFVRFSQDYDGQNIILIHKIITKAPF